MARNKFLSLKITYVHAHTLFYYNIYHLVTKPFKRIFHSVICINGTLTQV